MQIVKMMGGLGNQMFAYAFALALRKLGRDVRIDTTWYDRNEGHGGWVLGKVFVLDIAACSREERDRVGDLDPSFASRLRRKLFGERHPHLKEKGRGFDAGYLSVTGDAYFDGFWQSPHYHEGLESEIEGAFAFAAELEPRGLELMRSLNGRCAIGIHVRRGDYLGSPALSEVCSEEYFRSAIETLLEGATEPVLLFFSDDLDWCKRNLAVGREAVFVDWNRGLDSWRDMRLMTLCDRLAIANSSFSWWGARLGRGAERMIAAPSRWFGGGLPDNTEIKPPGWIQIDARGDRVGRR